MIFPAEPEVMDGDERIVPALMNNRSQHTGNPETPVGQYQVKFCAVCLKTACE